MKNFQILFTVFILSISVLGQSKYIHHKLNITVAPEKSEISVRDSVYVPSLQAKKPLWFKLNSSLAISAFSKNISLKKIASKIKSSDVGMDRDISKEKEITTNEYEIKFSGGKAKTFWIEYSGKIYVPIANSAEEYQRGFGQTPGIISNKGVYLAGSSGWVPAFGKELVTFTLKVNLPAGWKSVSQGERTFVESDSAHHFDEWREDYPQEEVFLIAAKFHEYSYDAEHVEIMAFLRENDEALANKYLERTAQYLKMYESLLGKYPYKKFALVENFWETGYGMPSFTLLGEKIIRFPFILYSSYPHELLHNWWGNSAYVDFSKGNWCEGITAYMADHLMKEKRGQGAEYRRATLQKFTDFVNEKNDFPLSKFYSRYDAPSEAIGYGKALMMWHMLRKMVGDNSFVKAFRLFYKQNKFRRASFDDIRLAFEQTVNKNLKWFFNQWVKRTGAPELKLDKVSLTSRAKDFLLKFNLHQIQKGKAFKLYVPVYVQTEKSLESFKLVSDSKNKVYRLTLSSKPLEILIDPQFDVFRKLEPPETPPSLTKAYGSQRTLILLPSKNEKNYNYYKTFAREWIRVHKEKFELAESGQVKNIPTDKAVWILGYNNKFLNIVNRQLKKRNSFVLRDSVRFGEAVNSTAGRDFICVVRNPKNVNGAIVWFGLGNGKAVAGLVRKLPHYGKYSYLAFEGNEPVNIAKGEWEALNSPLIKRLTSTFKVKVKIPKSKALALE